MADEVPISEVRRVLIEYEIRVPQGARAAPTEPSSQMSDRDLVQRVLDELIRHGGRNPDIFGGRA